MTIKKKLFFSNILMIIVPVILSIIITSIASFTLMRVLGKANLQQIQENEIYHTQYVEILKMIETWSNITDDEQVIKDASEFFNKYHTNNISLFIYEEDKLIYSFGEYADTALFKRALQETGNHNYVRDNIFISSFDTSKYKVIFINVNYYLEQNLPVAEITSMLSYFIVLIFVIVIAAVILTNSFLTRYVINSITKPLDNLVHGVNQIRDGNLEYRIEYNDHDEFTPVVDDFNEMAKRLLHMVNARQKDDENRRELIAGISHDLRTPLTTIIAYTEGLEKGIVTNTQMQQVYFNTIKNKAHDLEHIVAQLFLFSKLDIGEYPFNIEILDIGEVMKKFVSMVTPEYKSRGLFIELIENVQNVWIKADSVQLRNVFTNFLENSLKYASKSGQDKICIISCKLHDDDFIITFTDNGDGVAEDLLDKIFEVFYRGNKARTNPGQGSGLGLAMSKKIIERFNGRIRAYNSSEAGLSVEIILPIFKKGADMYEKDINN